MTAAPPEVVRQLLLEQLEIAWGFAERFVWPRIDQELCVWEPSDNTVTVRPHGDGWRADWPDEENDPEPETTVGWLLWHIDWWWSNTLRASRGAQQVAAAEHRWTGSLESIRDTRRAWVESLTTAPLEAEVEGLMPGSRPLWFVAGWVNFELTKNVTEIHQLIIRRSNTPRSHG